jgi:hypothetical protein
MAVLDPTDADHAEVARALLLKAVKVRADRGGTGCLEDIRAALANLDQKCAEGDWLALVGRAAVLLGQAQPEPMLLWP